MAKSKLPRFNLRSPRGEWVLVHHRSDALDELGASILGFAVPLALEVRATAVCATDPRDEEISALVLNATRTPRHGEPGIPARVVVESAALARRLQVALPGVAIQRGATASEVALMPTLVDAADHIEVIVSDATLDLSDDARGRLAAIMEILDDETDEFVQALEDENGFDEASEHEPSRDGPGSHPSRGDERAAPEEHSRLHAALLDAAASAVESIFHVARPKFDAVMHEAVDGSLNRQHAVVYAALAVEHAGTNAVGFARNAPRSSTSAAMRRALGMLADARASYFRIRATDPENGILTLDDVFAGDSVEVRDYGAARGLEPALYLFAVLVPHDRMHLCVAAHAQPLRSGDATSAIEEGHAKLGQRGTVPPARLREPSTLRALFGIWAAHARAAEARDFLPPLANHDGDPLLLTTDHFAFAANDRDAIVDLLSRGPDATHEPSDAEVEALIRWTRAPTTDRGLESVLWASLRVGTTSLRVESNSVRRADQARARVTQLAGQLVRHRAREHVDPTSPEVRATASKRPQKSIDATTEAEALRSFKAQHYGSWPDIPVPALDGKTPRAAAKNAKLRPRLARLLDDMTADEARAPVAHRFDFSGLRKELGL